PFEYTSREHVEKIGDWVGERLSDIWEEHATLPNVSKHSKSWWSRECSTRMKEVRTMHLLRKSLVKERKQWQARVVRAGQNFDVQWHQEVMRLTREIAACSMHIDRANKRLKGAVRRAKRNFFDEVIAKTHASRVWDLVEWTKPRRIPTTTGLVDGSGQPVDKPERVAEVFREQFTPTNPRQVDMSLLDEMPQHEERAFAPITEREICEVLAKTSNFSAPGPDNVSWFW
ncbi:hypothetical protein BC629DRAFT_1251154, partial [Irpex lacteus]